MLKYLLFKENEDKVIYRYYPEDGKESGLISVTKKSGECDIDELSPNDKHQRYAMKLFKRLKEFANNDSFEKEGIVAWS